MTHFPDQQSSDFEEGYIQFFFKYVELKPKFIPIQKKGGGLKQIFKF